MYDLSVSYTSRIKNKKASISLNYLSFSNFSSLIIILFLLKNDQPDVVSNYFVIHIRYND